MPKRKSIIEIMNLRNEKPSKLYDFRIDRSSPVGNKFLMINEGERNKVCNQYQADFFERITHNHNKKFNEYLKNMSDCLMYYGKLRLFCWCAPKRCHGETIRNYLLNKKE